MDDEALAQLRRAFPVRIPGPRDFPLDEPSDYPDGGEEGYGAIERDFMTPMARAQELSLRISTAIASQAGRPASERTHHGWVGSGNGGLVPRPGQGAGEALGIGGAPCLRQGFRAQRLGRRCGKGGSVADIADRMGRRVFGRGVVCGVRRLRRVIGMVVGCLRQMQWNKPRE